MMPESLIRESPFGLPRALPLLTWNGRRDESACPQVAAVIAPDAPPAATGCDVATPPAEAPVAALATVAANTTASRSTAPAIAAARASAPGPSWETHLDRLRRQPSDGAAAQGNRPRDPSWQRAERVREQSIRAEAVTLAQYLRDDGLSAVAVADLLGVKPRTLRSWQHDAATAESPPACLGRPHVHAAADEAEAVVNFLHTHGPHTGMPTLRGTFPAVAPAALHDLLTGYRHLWLVAHPRERCALDWQRPGTVWAMDFTQVRSPIDGCCRYVFAVRDLASGMQLAWQPVADLTAATAVNELTLLFTIHGAPLVLKSDNGSAFRAESLKAHLQRWRVWPLYSPPGAPWYNGAIEASIGSLKTRTRFIAHRHGHTAQWTSADLDQARDLANTTARPRGPQGPTPAEIWAVRQPPTFDELDVPTLKGLVAMALYLGPILGGPEQIDKGFCQQMDAIALRKEALQNHLIKSGDGLLNVVFLFSGTLFRPDFADIRVGRFIKKENRLEVRVPVPPDAISSADFAQRYVALLKQAIAEAKKVFDKKGVPFSLADHLALVDKSLEGLVEME